jgi:repressor LexA
MAKLTHRQGQFLAFLHVYRLLHRQGPAEADFVADFRVSPPSAHQMIVRLEELGAITREPGVARSARVAVPAEEVPALEPVEGPAW